MLIRNQVFATKSSHASLNVKPRAHGVFRVITIPTRGKNVSSFAAVFVPRGMDLQVNLMFFEFVLMNQCQPAFLRRVINFTMLMHVYVIFSVNLFCFLYVFDIVSMFTEMMFIRGALDDTEINDKIVNLDEVVGRKFTLMYS